MKPRLPVAGVLVIAFALLATACRGVANPEGWAAPVFEDNSALLFLKKDKLSAVSFDSGSATVLWTFPDHNLSSEKDISLESVYSDPIVDGDMVYVGSYAGEVYAIGKDDGRLRWSTKDQVDISGSIVNGPELAGDRLIFGTTQGFLYSVTTADGSPTPGWPSGGLNLSNRGIWATPIVEGNTAYVATMDGKVRAVDLAAGSELWDTPFSANSAAIAEISSASDSLLFVATLGKEVYFVDKATGTQVGPVISGKGWIWTRPAIEAGNAYFGDFEGTLAVVNITDQTEGWTAKTNGRVKSGPAVVGDWVVFADESPAVLFVNKANGEIRNRVPISGAGTIRANVVARDGVAYVVTTKGKLFKADPSNFSVVEVPIVSAS